MAYAYVDLCRREATITTTPASPTTWSPSAGFSTRRRRSSPWPSPRKVSAWSTWTLMLTVFISVLLGPDPHGSALIFGRCWVWIRIQDGKKDFQKQRYFMFWSARCFLLEAEDFSWSFCTSFLDGLEIKKNCSFLSFFYKKLNILAVKCYNCWSSKLWMRVRIGLEYLKQKRIHNHCFSKKKTFG